MSHQQGQPPSQPLLQHNPAAAQYNVPHPPPPPPPMYSAFPQGATMFPPPYFQPGEQWYPQANSQAAWGSGPFAGYPAQPPMYATDPLAGEPMNIPASYVPSQGWQPQHVPSMAMNQVAPGHQSPASLQGLYFPPGHGQAAAPPYSHLQQPMMHPHPPTQQAAPQAPYTLPSPPAAAPPPPATALGGPTAPYPQPSPPPPAAAAATTHPHPLPTPLSPAEATPYPHPLPPGATLPPPAPPAAPHPQSLPPSTAVGGPAVPYSYPLAPPAPPAPAAPAPNPQPPPPPAAPYFHPLPTPAAAAAAATAATAAAPYPHPSQPPPAPAPAAAPAATAHPQPPSPPTEVGGPPTPYPQPSPPAVGGSTASWLNPPAQQSNYAPQLSTAPALPYSSHAEEVHATAQKNHLSPLSQTSTSSTQIPNGTNLPPTSQPTANAAAPKSIDYAAPTTVLPVSNAQAAIPAVKADLQPTPACPTSSVPSSASSALKVSHHQRVVDILYSYQLELYNQAKDENTIVFCPTGSGKTMIALAVAEHIILDRPPRPKKSEDSNPQPRVIFLSDRMSLLEQQNDVFMERSIHVRTDVVHSERKSRGWSKIFQSRNVVFMMAAIFLNELEQHAVSICDFDLIIMDECHHCQRNHPFNKIFTFFYDKAPTDRRPQIFGMTASPGADTTLQRTSDKIRQLCTNMSSKIIMVRYNTDELMLRAPLPASVCKVIALSNSEQAFETVIMDCMVDLETFIRNLPSSDLDYKSDVKRNVGYNVCSTNGINIQKMNKNSPPYFQLMEQQAAFAQREQRFGLSRLFHCLYNLSKTLLYLSEVGTESAYQYLFERQQSLLQESLQDSDDLSKGVSNAHLKSTETTQCNAELHRVLSQLASGIQNIPLSHTNEKTDYILDKLWEMVAADPAHFRGIVLVQTKRGARRLCELIKEKEASQADNKTEGTLRPEVFVGHGNSAGVDRDTQVKGMNIKQQQGVLETFREGKSNVLVATNVAEEGLDIPACNLVIRYDVSFSLISLIQSRGRARREGGLFVVVLPAQDREKYESLMIAEANMKSVVLGTCIDVDEVLKEQLPWYELSPEKLVEQYFADFCAQKGIEKKKPHYVNVATMLRSGRQGWYSSLEIPVIAPNGQEEPICAYGWGDSFSRAQTQAAIRACGRLDDMQLLTYLRKGNQGSAHREFTHFTSHTTALTNAAPNEGQCIQVFDEKTWGDAVRPFKYLMEWCQRGNALSVPHCDWEEVSEGSFKCTITLRERVAGSEGVQNVKYQSPFACSTKDQATETTALYLLGKKNRWFQKKDAPRRHADRLLSQQLDRNAMEYLVIYRRRIRPPRNGEVNFQFSFVPVDPE